MRKFKVSGDAKNKSRVFLPINSMSASEAFRTSLEASMAGPPEPNERKAYSHLISLRCATVASSAQGADTKVSRVYLVVEGLTSP